MPATPGDARCLAALCAALEASRGGEAPERLLAGFAEALGAELAAGMRVVASAAGNPPPGASGHQDQSRAHLQIASLAGLTLADLAAMMAGDRR